MSEIFQTFDKENDRALGMNMLFRFFHSSLIVFHGPFHYDYMSFNIFLCLPWMFSHELERVLNFFSKGLPEVLQIIYCLWLLKTLY